MRYVDEFRDRAAAAGLLQEIGRVDLREPVTFMEVCGSHTMAISRFGIRSLLPETVRLVSGPGCPVCVTPVGNIDHAIALAGRPDVTIATFGDLIRVPGSESSLERERAAGADVRVVYSTLDALALARREPDRQVVFLGVGFETTAPTVAAALLEAEAAGLANFSVLSDHKVMPPPMRALMEAPEVDVRGFLCPGHVSAVIGANAYRFLADEYGASCVVAGFEPLDILQAILLLMTAGRPRPSRGGERLRPRRDRRGQRGRPSRTGARVHPNGGGMAGVRHHPGQRSAHPPRARASGRRSSLRCLDPPGPGPPCVPLPRRSSGSWSHLPNARSSPAPAPQPIPWGRAWSPPRARAPPTIDTNADTGSTTPGKAR